MPAGSTRARSGGAHRPGPRAAPLAGRVDGRLVDLRLPLTEDVAARDRDGPRPGGGRGDPPLGRARDGRRREAPVPGAQIDVGRTDHCEKFQYDFQVERPFTPEDLERIEDGDARRSSPRSAPFAREVVTRERGARAASRRWARTLKVSRLDDIPDGEPITLFRHGGFVDLCRGPHVQRTGQIGAVKLLEAAGAYWRGDERNRCSSASTAPPSRRRRSSTQHLARLEEAKRRDHRRVGAELELFHLDPLAPGSPFYLPKGMVLYNGLVDFMRSLYPKYGYQEVMTPQLFRAELFKTSGHYEQFHDDMFWFAGPTRARSSASSR